MKKKIKCPTCSDTKMVAYISLPKGKRVRRCPKCSGGEVPKSVLSLEDVPSKRKVTIWAPDYNPFILGGDVNAPMACEVEAEGPFPLGKGYEGYLVTSPKGTTFVAESKTGAIVGSTLKMVRDDIKAAKPSVMKKQVEDAAQLFKRARPISPKEFWAKMEKRS